VTEDERRAVAEELWRARASAAESDVPARDSADVLGAPRTAAPLRVDPLPADPVAPAPLQHPDPAAVNDAWDLSGALPSGPLARLARRLLTPLLRAQSAFNARQVELDNRLIEHLNARFAATHRHYDEVLGVHGRHMQEIDERHLLLQQDLVAHVHDLVKRIDLVLGESERSRLSLEAALKDARRRLEDLERRLGRG
jgi:hypothetical protein